MTLPVMTQVPVEPNRPAITPAQIAAIVVAGVPILANLLHVFGVYTLSQEQQDALTSTMQWALGLAGGLTIGDAYLRGKRNEAHAAVVTGAQQLIAAEAYADSVPPTAEDDSADDGDTQVGTLTAHAAEDDPLMGDPLDASPESFIADPRDRHGAKDHPEGEGPA